MSCSGTVGRTAFVRNDMHGMALTHDVIRIAGQPDRAFPGYLFAFLTSAPAQAMIHQHTYGSVVQHIEPHHLADLPVPLPDAPMQRRIHNLVEAAAAKRTEASGLLDKASAYFDAQMEPFRYLHEHALATTIINRSALRRGRLDAFSHCGWSAEAAGMQGDRLGSLAEVARPGIIKRLFAERGIPFVSGVDVYQLRPSARTRLRSDEAVRSDALISAGQILVQRSGQRYGLLGRPAYVGQRLNGWASSDHLMRIDPHDPAMTGHLFALLRSEAGRRQLVGQSYGTSIPAINPQLLAAITVPPLPSDLVDNANRALRLREEADADEERAIQEVEAWLS